MRSLTTPGSASSPWPCASRRAEAKTTATRAWREIHSSRPARSVNAAPEVCTMNSAGPGSWPRFGSKATGRLAADARAALNGLAVTGVAEHALALRWQLGLHVVQEQRDLVEQALRGARSLDDDRARELLDLVDLISRP